jgi:hypothetical protein
MPGDRSVDVYSRDSLAYPLLELGRIMEKVRNGEFFPDSSRSGRWKRPVPVEKDFEDMRCRHCDKTLKRAEAFLCECGNLVHDDIGFVDGCRTTCPWCLELMCGLCYGLGYHVCKISDNESSEAQSSTDDDSDGERVQMAIEDEEVVEVEAESTRANTETGIRDGSDALFPEGGVFINKVSGIVHMVKDPYSCGCGTMADETRFEYFYEASSILGRRLCWRSGCAKWEKPQDE